MTAEEAIEILKGNFGNCPSDCYSSCEKCLEEANELAIEALEKQIPKKPHRNYDKLSDVWCKCGAYIGRPREEIENGTEYCKVCGTKIDWSEE